MKFQPFLLALLPLITANPIADPDALADPNPNPLPAPVADADALPEAEIEARALRSSGALAARTCKLTGSDVKYRRGPGKNYEAVGQYGAKGTKVSFKCYTTGGSVGGNT